MFLKLKNGYYRNSIVMLASLFAITTCYAEVPICSLLLGGTPISFEALQALHDAKTSFEVEVLSKVIDGKERVVILAGETHIKTGGARSKGLNLIGHFDLRGIEGADLNSLGGRLLGPIMDAVNFVSKKIFRLKGSTITDAIVTASMEEAKQSVAIQIAETLLKEAGLQSMELTIEQEQKHLVLLGNMKISSGDVEVDPVELLKVIKVYLSANSEMIASEQRKIVNIQLEVGHKPNFKENLDVAQLPLTLGLLGLTFAISPFAGHGNQTVDVADKIITGIVYLNSAYTWAELAMKKKFSSKPWFSAVFPTYGGLLDGRNQTMVANIEKGLIEHPESDQMLIIVGKAHVKGMKSLLQDQYRFSSAPLTDLPSTSQ
jgi:hypothetical protein